MDTTYKAARTTPSLEVHADAKEVNDLINALVDKNGNVAKEAIDAIMALSDDVVSDDRFVHFYDVMNATLTNQLKARYIEQQPELASGADLDMK